MRPTSRTRLRITLAICILLVMAGTVVRWNGFTFVSWWRENHSGRVFTHAQTTRRVVALTIDDGPDPAYTPRVLDILNHYGAHATFFEEGKMVRLYPELARRTLREGHVIGNHTFNHPYIERMDRRGVQNEIDGCEQAITAATGMHTGLFRPPRGAWNPTIFAEVERHNSRIILWSVALEHEATPTPQQMADRVLSQIRPGYIILMHDGVYPPRESSVRALPILLEGLRKQGYTVVTIPELLGLPGNSPEPIKSKGV